MSINRYSSDQIPEAHLCFSHYMMDNTPSPKQNPTFISTLIPKPTNFFTTNNTQFYYHATTFNPNNDDEEELISDNGSINDASEMEIIPKEPLFEKPLTPSDVGKLNRLVIPKQHAEKYFPLRSGGDDTGEKGFLLSFEDEMAKCWRFRYSYWNSSQSYVLTKGWSRFVKEKRLDAGDFVLFLRHQLDCGRLFIGWRRRHSAVDGGGQVVAAGGGYGRGVYTNTGISPHLNQQCSFNNHPYQPNCHHADSVFQAQTSGNSKKLRLFGVNLECQTDESETERQGQHNNLHPLNPYQHQFPSSHQNQKDIKFSLKSDGYHQG